MSVTGQGTAVFAIERATGRSIVAIASGYNDRIDARVRYYGVCYCIARGKVPVELAAQSQVTFGVPEISSSGTRVGSN